MAAGEIDDVGAAVGLGAFPEIGERNLRREAQHRAQDAAMRDGEHARAVIGERSEFVVEEIFHARGHGVK